MIMDDFDFLVNSIVDFETLEKEGKLFTKGETKYYNKIISEDIYEIILIEKQEYYKENIKYINYIVDIIRKELISKTIYRRRYMITKYKDKNGMEITTSSKIEKKSETSQADVLAWLIICIILMMIIIYLIK